MGADQEREKNEHQNVLQRPILPMYRLDRQCQRNGQKNTEQNSRVSPMIHDLLTPRRNTLMRSLSRVAEQHSDRVTMRCDYMQQISPATIRPPVESQHLSAATHLIQVKSYTSEAGTRGAGLNAHTNRG